MKMTDFSKKKTPLKLILAEVPDHLRDPLPHPGSGDGMLGTVEEEVVGDGL